MTAKAAIRATRRGQSAASHRQASARPAIAPSVLHPMTGHSGAEICLCAQGSRSFVRKTAGHPKENERLLQQSEKLRLLARFSLNVPRVLREGRSESGCAYYDMEYVPARTAASAICDGATVPLPALLGTLERMFRLFQLTQGETIRSDAFRNKIALVADAASAGIGRAQGDAIAAAAARLDAMCWDGIPASESHGDLTLENILITADERVVLIDCDAGWLSSWWIDAAKLYQDASGHWFLRNLYLEDETGLALLRATQRLNRLKALLDARLASLDAGLPQRIGQLAALHLLRTLPYARDERLVGFVLSRIDRILSISRS